MKTKLTYSIAAAIAVIGMSIFVSCSGGSSDGSTDTTAATVLEGTFVDSAVEGIDFKGKFSGKTDKDGHYSFVAGERVEFTLGTDIKLGSLLAKTSPVSPLDFFDGTKTASDQEVINLIVLFQSLDTDGDPTNGIEILPQTIEILEAAILASGGDPATFDPTTESSADLKTLLDAVIATTPSTDDMVPSEEDAVEHFTESLYGPQPPVADINGTALACTPDLGITYINDAADFNASQTEKRNISSSGLDDDNRERGNSHNAIARLSTVVDGKHADGNATGEKVHPIAISYLQEVVGTAYEMGDGSADIGDPNQRDALFFALSLDNGDSWKNQVVSDSTTKTSTKVTWDGTQIDYYGHAQKPKMAMQGNRILMAWHDKYCPSGNPFDLVQGEDGNYSDDFFFVNGVQGSIDYTEDDGTVMIAPNGKEVFEVPFSCIWTARGIFDPADGNIMWHAPVQLTTGRRDSNHIWLEASDAGFAMAWQEDTTGLRSGKGAGPGDGWSGATTNHGTDIWYTSLKISDFDDVNGTDDETAKPKSLHNFHYPMRITDNEQCSVNDTKSYCKSLCDTYGSQSSTTNNSAGTAIERCKTYDIDMLTNTQVVLDGDTGASRSAIKILKTDQGESVVILSYEETKGLSENTTGTGDQDQGDADTIIEFEGKSIYFESFNFNAIDDFNASDPDIIQKMAMPLVSAGNIVNMKVPAQDDPSNMIYENSRRVVIGTQVDSCDASNFTFALLYKQSFETQGASSDMFVRVNNGFTYDSFVALNDATAGDLDTTNISSSEPLTDINASDYDMDWSAANLDDNTYYHMNDNTFSPRIFLRGNNIYTGYVYTPDANKTASENGSMPSNFFVHTYTNGAWQGPVNVTRISKASATSVDPRLFTTPKGNSTSLVVSDQNSDRNVLFLTWGEIDFIDYQNKSLGKSETDLFYKRSIDGGLTWDAEPNVIANREGGIIEEKEVNSFASPDGKMIYNVWLQEEEHYDNTDPFSGLDTWFGRVDYNISIP
ncbi:choice-of-anchor O protein [Sulfurimonas sp.]|uniref:choice-of-anchor O protein n=1 Tax=Sulfurimonas sp. TaxID=2022749 RepID=UPI003563210E